MLKLKIPDTFSRNVLLVFLGSSLVNFLNLLYQLLVAHRLLPADFASFNVLLSVYSLVGAGLGTFQLAIIKYTSEYHAQQQSARVRTLLSDLFRKSITFALLTFLIFGVSSGYLLKILKIDSPASGWLLALGLAVAWPLMVFSGAVQGIERFNWFASGSVASGIAKLAFSFIFIVLGFKIAGALGGLLAANLISLVIFYFPVREFIRGIKAQEKINYKELLAYSVPVAVSNCAFIALVSFDLVAVKYFFSVQDSGIYALAQMVGKIFLFLPGAVVIVMFPRLSILNAKQLETGSTLKKSLLYVLGLSVLAAFVYNLLPYTVLEILTGKAYAQAVFLGRLFSISMCLFALVSVLINYFLALKDMRFLRYLVGFTACQFLAIAFWHQNLAAIQVILCINAGLLLVSHLRLAFKK